MKALYAGCGDSFMPGWINVDLASINAIKNANEKYSDLINDSNYIQTNLEENFPFEDEEFDYIYSEHLIEHLSFDGCINYLNECYRCLKPGGILRTAWPSLEFLFELWQHPNNYRDYIQNHCLLFHKELLEKYKNDTDISPIYIINDNYRMWGHQIMYDIPTLKKLFKETGFINIKQVNWKESSHIELQNIEHSNKRGEKLNKLETAILECEKHK